MIPDSCACFGVRFVLFFLVVSILAAQTAPFNDYTLLVLSSGLFEAEKSNKVFEIK